MWTTWRTLERGKLGFAIDGTAAKSNDPSTWMTRSQAQDCLVEYDHEGIQIALSPVGKYLLGGIDLDACIDTEGDLDPWAEAIVKLVDTYTEVSPSGTGLHLYFLAPLELTDKRWRKHVQRKSPRGGKDQGIECYLGKHFLAVTDQTYQHYDTVRLIDEETLGHVQIHMREFDQRKRPQQPVIDETERLYSAIDAMANSDLSWEDWNTQGMAIYRVSTGSHRGFEAFRRFSQKSSKYDERACTERWENWRRSPPDQVNEGTIFFWALEAGWQDPRPHKPNGHAKNGNGHAYSMEPDNEPDSSGSVALDKPVIDFIDAAELLARPLPELVFAVDGLIRHCAPFLIGGDSGSGKSILAQTWCTIMAAGDFFLGRRVRNCIAAYFTGEDDLDILHIRQDRINRVLGIEDRDIEGRLFLCSMVDRDVFLYSNGRPTDLALELEQHLSDMRAGFAIIDSASLVFDDEEIRRRPVAHFARHIGAMGRRIEATIGLIAHTSRSSRADATHMVSGSTAWVAQFRAGLLTEPCEGGVKLSLHGANYTERDQTFELVWKNGVLIPKPPPDKVESLKEQNIEKLIRSEVAKDWDAGRPLSLSAKAKTRYLPPIMKARHDINPGLAERLAVAMVRRGDLLERQKTDKVVGLCTAEQDPRKTLHLVDDPPPEHQI